MGVLGILFSGAWMKLIYNPKEHPMISVAELEHIEQNGGLVDMDKPKQAGKSGPKWGYIKQLLSSRMMLGIYLGQYCINAITYFFLTWFPVYLVQERGMSILKAGFIASLPAICGFIGGVLGGIISDHLLRRGNSLTFARKAPIVIGLLLSTSMIICNYVDAEWMVVGIMALAFFGKGLGALGWAVVSDTSPKQIAGLSGGMFNTFGNIASITTPIIIGYIISATGSFKWALVYVGANALVAVFSYLVIVGPIKRIELREDPSKNGNAQTQPATGALAESRR
jgi:ACS family glucarate transporter-like MFS transporter